MIAAGCARFCVRHSDNYPGDPRAFFVDIRIEAKILSDRSVSYKYVELATVLESAAMSRAGEIMKLAEVTTDKRRIRGEESRKLILKSAIDNIAISGLGSLTLDRVADKLGVSRGLVVFHFKSKNNLIMEVLEYLSKQYSGGWNAIVSEETPGSMEKLLRLVDYDIRFACENPKYVSAWHAFWGESRGKQMFHQLVLPRDQAYAADMGQLLEEISAQEGYHELDIPTVTRGLVSMMFGAWVLVHLNPGPDDYATSMKAVRLYLGRIFPDTELAEL